MVTSEGEGGQGDTRGLFPELATSVCLVYGEKIIILMIWVSGYMILYFDIKLQKQNCQLLPLKSNSHCDPEALFSVAVTYLYSLLSIILFWGILDP